MSRNLAAWENAGLCQHDQTHGRQCNRTGCIGPDFSAGGLHAGGSRSGGMSGADNNLRSRIFAELYAVYSENLLYTQA